MPVETLPAFSVKEQQRAYRLLVARVAHMGTRKFEEGDWTDVYCGAKGIPKTGWSNLHIDIIHDAVGVEQKMMSRSVNRPITAWCGTMIMHPSATRALRIDSINRDADAVMADVFRQYGELIERRTQKIRQMGFDQPDMRTGWLLWQESLRQFLYFEERMKAPDPKDYYAIWNEHASSATRLGSKNLWIYERASKQKRFSVTTQAGIKLQPYFEVPPMDDRNLYVFIAQGEEAGGGQVRLWLTTATARDLYELVGDLEVEHVSNTILSAELRTGADAVIVEGEKVVEVLVSDKAYVKLSNFSGFSDEHRVRAFIANAQPMG